MQIHDLLPRNSQIPREAHVLGGEVGVGLVVVEHLKEVVVRRGRFAVRGHRSPQPDPIASMRVTGTLGDRQGDKKEPWLRDVQSTLSPCPQGLQGSITEL